MKKFVFTQEVECTIWETVTYEVEAPCETSARRKIEEEPWNYETDRQTNYDTQETTGVENEFELDDWEQLDSGPEVRCTECDWEGDKDDLIECYDEGEHFDGCPNCETDEYLEDI